MHTVVIYMIKMKVNIANWLRMVGSMDINISEFLFLKFL